MLLHFMQDQIQNGIKSLKKKRREITNGIYVFEFINCIRQIVKYQTQEGRKNAFFNLKKTHR